MAIEASQIESVIEGVPLSELARAAGTAEFVSAGNPQISGITFDSRAVKPGDLFVALRGGYYDGHTFVRDAVAGGAVAVLVEEPVSEPVPQLVVPNTRAALAQVSAQYYRHPSKELTVIGVTGTDGKTTTSYLINDILTAAGRKTGLIGTVSVKIAGAVVEHETRQTTPESLEVQQYLRTMVETGVDTAILEATSHGLDLHRLDEIDFDVAAVTNITHEHLEHHKTIEAYRQAKAILFERVGAARGSAVINLDDAGALEMRSFSTGASMVTYSMLDQTADLFARDIALGVEGSRFTLVDSGDPIDVSLPMVGAFNVSNALCAAGVAVSLGIGTETIAAALEKSSSVPGRMARVDEGQSFTVIVDYAHTPESLTKVMELLQSLTRLGRLIAVSGSAGERDVEKRPLQGGVGQRLADVSIFTTEDPRFEDADKIIAEIAAGAVQEGGILGESYHCVTDRREAIRLAFDLASPGDVVLLAGKGHERSIIWGREKRPWDEEAVARELLRDAGYRKVK